MSRRGVHLPHKCKGCGRSVTAVWSLGRCLNCSDVGVAKISEIESIVEEFLTSYDTELVQQGLPFHNRIEAARALIQALKEIGYE